MISNRILSFANAKHLLLRLTWFTRQEKMIVIVDIKSLILSTVIFSIFEQMLKSCHIFKVMSTSLSKDKGIDGSLLMIKSLFFIHSFQIFRVHSL